MRVTSRVGARAIGLAAVWVSACGVPGRQAETGARIVTAPRSASVPRLISTAEAAELMRAREPAILDVRTDVAAYLKGHLPGAAYLNPETLRATENGVPNLILSAGSYTTLFSRLGVSMDHPVILYSAGETRNIDATYAAWILAGFGHPELFVLDGGIGKWEMENREVARKYPGAPARGFPARPFAPERAILADVRAALGRAATVLVDARVREQYTGEAGAQARRGHIPGAINHYWQDDLAQSGFARVWKNRDELRASYAGQGITPDRQIIVYCNGGLESSHVYFALRALLGFPNVRVYDGSWTEWAERDELPVERGSGRR